MILASKEKCTACQSCANSCPKSAITMVADEEGFHRPSINSELCVSCGICEKKCPLINRGTVQTENIAYAAINTDKKIRSESSSGGIFFLLAKAIIQQKGVVFGAKYDSDFSVKHGYAETMEGIYELQGSKYVQSDIGSSYKQAEAFLKQGRIVLFTGTPCQIGGLYAYLGRQYENLYCQDIICHGVPSPMVWQKYIEYREAKAASKTRRTFFRHKEYGWKTFSVLFEFTNSTEYVQILTKDLYMRSFLCNLTLRPSCYDCAYKSVNRQADITLADFWGVEKMLPEMDDNKGTSLVITHSEKGKQLLNMIQEQIKYQKVDLDKAVSYNSAMLKSAPINPQRDSFLKEILSNPFDKIVNKYCKDSFRTRGKRFVKRIIQKLTGK